MTNSLQFVRPLKVRSSGSLCSIIITEHNRVLFLSLTNFLSSNVDTLKDNAVLYL